MGRKRVRKKVSEAPLVEQQLGLPSFHVLTGKSARIFQEKAARNAANAHKLDFSEERRWVESILRKSGML
jgi:hypothetical protein